MSRTHQLHSQSKGRRTATHKKFALQGYSARSFERVFIAGAILVSLAIVGLLTLNRPPGIDTSLPDTSESVADLGNAHVLPGTPHPPYNSNPSTSGWHDAQPAPWGVYQSSIPDEMVIHNLEHGGIWLSYRDADDTEVIQQLTAIANRYPTHVILTQRPANDSRIAVAAWGRLLKMDAVDSVQIHNFIQRYRQRGPENVE